MNIIKQIIIAFAWHIADLVCRVKPYVAWRWVDNSRNCFDKEVLIDCEHKSFGWLAGCFGVGRTCTSAWIFFSSVVSMKAVHFLCYGTTVTIGRSNSSRRRSLHSSKIKTNNAYIFSNEMTSNHFSAGLHVSPWHWQYFTLTLCLAWWNKSERKGNCFSCLNWQKWVKRKKKMEEKKRKKIWDLFESK